MRHYVSYVASGISHFAKLPATHSRLARSLALVCMTLARLAGGRGQDCWLAVGWGAAVVVCHAPPGPVACQPPARPRTVVIWDQSNRSMG